MQLSSLGHRRLWSVVFPLLGELVFILYLIALKFYFRAARQDSPEEATLERALCLNGNGHTQDNVSGTRKNIRDEQKEAPNDMKEQPEEGAVEADEENGWGRARRARSHNSDSASVGVWNRQGFAVRVDRAISSEDYTPPAVEVRPRGRMHVYCCCRALTGSTWGDTR